MPYQRPRQEQIFDQYGDDSYQPVDIGGFDQGVNSNYDFGNVGSRYDAPSYNEPESSNQRYTWSRGDEPSYPDFPEIPRFGEQIDDSPIGEDPIFKRNPWAMEPEGEPPTVQSSPLYHHLPLPQEVVPMSDSRWRPSTTGGEFTSGSMIGDEDIEGITGGDSLRGGGRERQNAWDLYKPETAAQNRYNELIENMPQRSRPNWAEMLVASAAGFGPGGLKAADEALWARQNRGLADWNTQVGHAQKGADLERQSNINERQMAYQIGQTQAASRRSDITEDRNRQLAKDAENRRSIEYAKLNKYIIDKSGPTLRYINPMDPTDIHISDVPTFALTKQDELELRHQNRLKELEVQGANSAEAARIRAGAGGSDVDSHSQDKVGRANRAREIENDPKFKGIIRWTGTNEYTIRPPSGGGWFEGPKLSPEDRAAITAYIEGRGPRPGSSGVGSSSVAPIPGKGSANVPIGPTTPPTGSTQPPVGQPGDGQTRYDVPYPQARTVIIDNEQIDIPAGEILVRDAAGNEFTVRPDSNYDKKRFTPVR